MRGSLVVSLVMLEGVCGYVGLPPTPPCVHTWGSPAPVGVCPGGGRCGVVKLGVPIWELSPVLPLRKSCNVNGGKLGISVADRSLSTFASTAA